MDFLLTPDDLERAYTPSTKGLLYSSPSNPAGSVYSRDQLNFAQPRCVTRSRARLPIARTSLHASLSRACAA